VLPEEPELELVLPELEELDDVPPELVEPDDVLPELEDVVPSSEPQPTKTATAAEVEMRMPALPRTKERDFMAQTYPITAVER
jgi:hypothetical protein